jgi:nicotinate-nucleotide--dimethylbenzimidazole phosphoribosyltransferase
VELIPMIYPNIPLFDQGSAEQARLHQDQLTKPPGSLGVLEELSIQLAGIQGKPTPSVTRKLVIVMAGDHGVVRAGVSAYPADVTYQMVLNFLKGGAAINVLARQVNARVVVVDMGVAADIPDTPGLVQRKVAHGTRNFALEPAMTPEQAEQALQAGIEVATQEIHNGIDLIATGDMGIGNTTASTAIAAAITGLPVADLTGRGTGLDDEGLIRKIAIIEGALQRHKPDPFDAFDVLCKVGGFEIAGLAGVIIGSAARRVAVVVDGFISGAAALIAVGLVPQVRPFLIASHRSVEIGHRTVLEKLGLRPLFDLNLRLGEGTGAVLAFSLIEASTRILAEMATFTEAGVSEKVT